MPAPDPACSLEDAERRTLALMDELGRRHLGRSLLALGWTFRFDRARRRMGACTWSRKGPKVISLSRPYVLANGWIEDIARHEVAHALDYETRGRSGHDAAWKAWARRCGADPTRLYEGDDLKPVASRYVGVCPSCGKEYAYHRKLKRAHACDACCRAHAGGRYDERFQLVLFDRSTGQPVAPPRTRRPSRPKYTGTCPHCGRQQGFARKLKRAHACGACCERFSGGRYDPRFDYVLRKNY